MRTLKDRVMWIAQQLQDRADAILSRVQHSHPEKDVYYGAALISVAFGEGVPPGPGDDTGPAGAPMVGAELRLISSLPDVVLVQVLDAALGQVMARLKRERLMRGER